MIDIGYNSLFRHFQIKFYFFVRSFKLLKTRHLNLNNISLKAEKQGSDIVLEETAHEEINKETRLKRINNRRPSII
jgi:hypothetical protein